MDQKPPEHEDNGHPREDQAHEDDRQQAPQLGENDDQPPQLGDVSTRPAREAPPDVAPG